MKLGAFSISLSVKDLQASKEFYEKLGFVARGGDETTWLVMTNGTTVIGLFQGMFEKNMLTFNPGWDQEANPLESFTDVRKIQQQLKESGIELETGVDPNSETGPGHLVVIDPDGNPILIDQHVTCSV